MVKIPDEVKSFGYEIESDPEKINKTAANNLIILKEQAEKLLSAFQEYCRSEDAVYKDTLLDAMNTRLNRVVQAFKDIIAYISIVKDGKIQGQTIRYYIRYFDTFNLTVSSEAKKALEFMNKRNDLVHDYFSIDSLNLDLLKGLESYGSGFTEVADALTDYCIKNISGIDLNKNMKKEIKKRNR